MTGFILSPSDIDNILAYLATLRRRQSAAAADDSRSLMAFSHMGEKPNSLISNEVSGLFRFPGGGERRFPVSDDAKDR